MKRLAIAILPALIFATPASALVGGPWDNDVPGGNQLSPNGTYQGVIVGKDLTGVMMFGTATTSNGNNKSTTTSSFNLFTGSSTTATTSSLATGLGTSGNEGRVAIFTNGVLVIGELSAVINLPGRSISATLDGSRLRSVQTITKRNVGGSILSSVDYTYNDVVTVSGAFQSRITQSFPQLLFSGEGSVTIKDPMGVIEVDITPQVDPTGTSSVQTTELQPVFVEPPNVVKIRVSGAKTASIAPSFTGSVTVQQASVTSSN